MKQKRTQEIKKMLCVCENCSDSTSEFDKLLELGKKLEENNDLDVLERFTSAIASKERLIIIIFLFCFRFFFKDLIECWKT